MVKTVISETCDGKHWTKCDACKNTIKNGVIGVMVFTALKTISDTFVCNETKIKEKKELADELTRMADDLNPIELPHLLREIAKDLRGKKGGQKSKDKGGLSKHGV